MRTLELPTRLTAAAITSQPRVSERRSSLSRQCSGQSEGLRSRYGCWGVPLTRHTEDHDRRGGPRVTIVICLSLRQPFVLRRSFTVQSTVLNIIQILTQLSSAPPATRTRLPEHKSLLTFLALSLTAKDSFSGRQGTGLIDASSKK